MYCGYGIMDADSAVCVPRIAKDYSVGGYGILVGKEEV